jgi:hypothetical protein
MGPGSSFRTGYSHSSTSIHRIRLLFRQSPAWRNQKPRGRVTHVKVSARRSRFHRLLRRSR